MREQLPKILHDSWSDFCAECRDSGQIKKKESVIVDGLIKLGFELCYNDLKPLLAEALPYLEAYALHTEIKEGDGKILLLIAKIQELVKHNN